MVYAADCHGLHMVELDCDIKGVVGVRCSGETGEDEASQESLVLRGCALVVPFVSSVVVVVVVTVVVLKMACGLDLQAQPTFLRR